ncbi:hypothetical protein [uncultured Tateyamaria sp.]|uniref:hypothetical protein n=1 Tax=uncultured Tateyamaria sp. TaxID=455651 RepID=UPI002613A307|nr:hypothetical protein [uncultured Tateyamaria sp.]
MLVVIDTGLATTKVATMDGNVVKADAFASAVVRGLIGRQAGGVYCLGQTTKNFQIYSVLACEYGVFPIRADGFRDPSNTFRRVLVEHAMNSLSVTGETSLILTQPAPLLFSGGEDQAATLGDVERSLLRMEIGSIDPSSGLPSASKWKLREVAASVETAWAIYDLAIYSPASAREDLERFTKDHVSVDAIVAIVDIGATGTRIHYVEWTGELLPTLVMSQYHESGCGTEELAAQIDRRFVETHGYRDVIDVPELCQDPTIFVAGARTDVSDLVDDAVSATVDHLNGECLDRLKAEVASGDVGHVLFVGGGAHTLGKAAAQDLPGHVVLKVDQPEQAGVRGLLKVRASNDRGGRS